MAVPLLIDTDMGIDDAVAACMAITSDALEVRSIVGVGGNAPVDQVVANIGRLMAATRPPDQPKIGRGLDQAAAAGPDRRARFGDDGFGNCDLPSVPMKAIDFRQVYRETIEGAEGDLVILALGPLTNLAAFFDESPELFKSVKQIHLTGGAVWTRGNATESAEFNFHRDPSAAAKLLASGLPITVTPLDVTNLVCLDESHVAHLAASGYRTGEVLAKLLRFAIEQDDEPSYGKCHVADALTVGSLLWPDLFLKTRMRLEITTRGTHAGQSKPALGGDHRERVDLLTAVNAVDFLENLLEQLCHEAFVV